MLDPHQAEKLWQEAADLFRGEEKQGHTKAIEIALRLIKDGPNDAVSRSRLQCFIADIYSLKLGQHDIAIGYYEEALRTNPGNSLAGSNLGSVYLSQKRDYESAARILQQTLDRGISDAFIRESTRDWLADAKQKMGQGHKQPEMIPAAPSSTKKRTGIVITVLILIGLCLCSCTILTGVYLLSGNM